MIVLLIPPLALVVALLVLVVRRHAVGRSRPVDTMEAHRRKLAALDPRAAAAAAREPAPPTAAPIRRHA